MLELALTTKCCQDILKYLQEAKSWTSSKIAKMINQPIDYVDRIAAGKQSFQVADVEALAKMAHLAPAMLIFNSVRPEELSPKERELHSLVELDIKRHQEFQKVMSRKPVKKRRPRKVA